MRLSELRDFTFNNPELPFPVYGGRTRLRRRIVNIISYGRRINSRSALIALRNEMMFYFIYVDGKLSNRMNVLNNEELTFTEPVLLNSSPAVLYPNKQPVQRAVVRVVDYALGLDNVTQIDAIREDVRAAFGHATFLFNTRVNTLPLGS